MLIILSGQRAVKLPLKILMKPAITIRSILFSERSSWSLSSKASCEPASLRRTVSAFIPAFSALSRAQAPALFDITSTISPLLIIPLLLTRLQEVLMALLRILFLIPKLVRLMVQKVFNLQDNYMVFQLMLKILNSKNYIKKVELTQTKISHFLSLTLKMDLLN